MYIHTHNLAHHSQTAGEKKDLKICEGSQEKKWCIVLQGATYES